MHAFNTSQYLYNTCARAWWRIQYTEISCLCMSDSLYCTSAVSLPLYNWSPIRMQLRNRVTMKSVIQFRHWCCIALNEYGALRAGYLCWLTFILSISKNLMLYWVCTLSIWKALCVHCVIKFEKSTAFIWHFRTREQTWTNDATLYVGIWYSWYQKSCLL